MKVPKTLDDLRDEIDEQVDYIDIKPYSHNIIGLVLSMIAKEYGQVEANQAIRDFGLEERGWSQHEVRILRP